MWAPPSSASFNHGENTSNGSNNSHIYVNELSEEEEIAVQVEVEMQRIMTQMKRDDAINQKSIQFSTSNQLPHDSSLADYRKFKTSAPTYYGNENGSNNMLVNTSPQRPLSLNIKRNQTDVLPMNHLAGISASNLHQTSNMHHDSPSVVVSSNYIFEKEVEDKKLLEDKVKKRAQELVAAMKKAKEDTDVQKLENDLRNRVEVEAKRKAAELFRQDEEERKLKIEGTVLLLEI